MKKTLLLLNIFLFFIGVSAALSQVPNYVPTNGLVGWWPFNGNANDESGNGNNGTVNGATLTTDRFGVANKAYNFDGNDWIELNLLTAINNSNAMAVSVWVKSTGTNSNTNCISGCAQYYFSRGNDGGNGFIINTAQGNNPYFSCSVNGPFNGGQGVVNPNNTAIPHVQWNHLLINYDGINIKFYVNGLLVGTTPYTTNVGVGNTTNAVFGRQFVPSFPYYAVGRIDDGAIWNRSLTSCEINDLYNAQLNSFSANAGLDFTKTCTANPNGAIIGTSSIVGQTYSWIPSTGLSSATVSNPTANPTITTTYTLTTTNSSGCTATDQVLVTVNNPLPTVNAGADQTICTGNTVTLSGTGANTYAWNNNVSNGVAFTPTASGTYSVTGTNTATGCTNTDQVVVTVNPLPTVNAGADQSVCAGTAVTLFASGANTYAWNNNVSNGVAFTPTASGTYSVTGTDANGCTNTDQVAVTVNPLPSVNAGADQSICKGAAVTLSATGATSYAWNNNVTNGVAFNPIATATYSVSGTDANGCTNADEVIVTVNEASASTLTESAMDSYTLNGQTYTQSGTYTQTLTNAAGCDSTITLNLTLSFTGLGELSQAIRIFPNPANDVLNIESTSPLIGDYTMYDAAGRVILQGTFTGMTTSIDVRNIAPGTYTLQAKELLERVVVLRR